MAYDGLLFASGMYGQIPAYLNRGPRLFAGRPRRV
jgi:hypothetical protein